MADSGGSAYRRATGPFHRVLALHKRPTAEILRVNLLAHDRAAVDALHAQVAGEGAEYGVTHMTDPAALDQPGRGYGFAFRDGEGRNIAVVSDIATHSDTQDIADRPRKLAHVVLNADEPEAAVNLFTGLLGFRVSDRTRMHNFLRCGDASQGLIVHHNIAIGNGAARS